MGLLLLGSVLSFAQKGIIKVTDSKNEALAFVNLRFEPINKGTKQYASTNLNGELANPCTDTCRLQLSSVGYVAMDTLIAPGKSYIIRLQQDVFNLNQVVVTATRTNKSLKDAPVITQLIDAKEISRRGLVNVQDILEQDIPGLEFQRGGFGADIKLQGLDAKNILILVDGERLAGENGNNVDYSRLNAASIERIEIIKGAASALYGSQAMGGVINIITKNSRKKWEATVGGRWAQKNETNYPDLQTDDSKYQSKKNLDRPNLNGNASFGFRNKYISGRTDFAAKSFDGYLLYDKTSITKEFVNIDTVIYDAANPFPTGINGYRDYSISQKFQIPITKKLDLKLRGSYYNHNEYDFVPDNVFQQFEDYSYGGKLNYRISDKYQLIASYNYDNYRKYDYFEKLDEKEVNYRNVFINPRLIGSAQVGKKQLVTGGFEYFGESLLSDKFSGNQEDEKSSSTNIIFLQDDISPSKKWNIIAGLRMDNHSAFGLHFSPKLSAMYKAKHWTYRANYARGFRSPTLKELYMDWPVAWFTIKGDANLQPETNNYFSLSSEWNRSFISASATAHYNVLHNKIEGVWKQQQTVYQYVNVESAKISGLEIMVRFYLLNHFILSGAYNYLHDERPQGQLVSSASPHSGNIKLNYRLLRKKFELNINLSSVIIGAKDYMVSEQIMYRGELTEGIYPVHFEAYSIWRLAVNQNFKRGVTITFGIDNIFNYTADIVSFNSSVSPGRRVFLDMQVDIDNLFRFSNKNK